MISALLRAGADHDFLLKDNITAPGGLEHSMNMAGCGAVCLVIGPAIATAPSSGWPASKMKWPGLVQPGPKKTGEYHEERKNITYQRGLLCIVCVNFLLLFA